MSQQIREKYDSYQCNDFERKIGKSELSAVIAKELY